MPFESIGFSVKESELWVSDSMAFAKNNGQIDFRFSITLLGVSQVFRDIQAVERYVICKKYRENIGQLEISVGFGDNSRYNKLIPLLAPKFWDSRRFI